jgi:hypothetical protein
MTSWGDPSFASLSQDDTWKDKRNQDPGLKLAGMTGADQKHVGLTSTHQKHVGMMSGGDPSLRSG